MRGRDGSVGSAEGGPRGPRAAPAGESDRTPASSRPRSGDGRPAPDVADSDGTDGDRMDGERMDGERMDGERTDGERMDGDRTDGERMDGDRTVTDGAGGRDVANGTGPVPTAEPGLGELEDRWRRAVADLDNLRKRCARELATERAAERARVAALWLPVVDNLERALEHAGTADDPVVEGVRAVRDQAVAVLATLGFTRHGEVGVPFDAQRHDAVAARPEPGVQPGTVVEVLRPGYGDGANQLRPAAVVVATATA